MLKIRYFEKRGYIWIDFRVDGKRTRLPTTATTEAQASLLAPAIVASALSKVTPQVIIAPAAPLAHPGMTLLKAYQKALKERESWVQSKDKVTLQITFDNLGLPEDTPVASLTREKVLSLRSAWLTEPGKRIGSTLSPSTINHRLSMLSALLDIAELPPHTVKHLSTKGNRRERRITDLEIQKGQAWLCAHGHLSGALDLCALITVALESCARQDEWLSRPWADIAEDTVTFRDTKNSTSRTIPLTSAAKAVLEARRGLPGGPFAALTADRITALWSQMRAGLGLAAEVDFVFHGLRHESISRLADKNANAFTIQAIAGHASVMTTQLYVRSSVAAMASVMNPSANGMSN